LGSSQSFPESVWFRARQSSFLFIHTRSRDISPSMSLRLLLVVALCDSSVSRIISENAADSIRAGRSHVERGFAPQLLVSHLQADAASLHAAGLFYGAGSGGRAAEVDSMRSAESCDPIDRDRSIGNWDAFFAIWERLDLVRQELQEDLGIELLPEMEISYVHYPIGGYYQRHVDDTVDRETRIDAFDVGRVSETSRRAISFVCALVDDDWSDADGGALRTFVGEAHEDVLPSCGTLVLFDSTRLHHEVLCTNRNRLVLVGWWHTPRESELKSEQDNSMSDFENEFV
jgi:SM-20-related protein